MSSTRWSSLEAHRAGSVVVGEDLGTVPAGVRERMAEDHMLRSWVLQFESSAHDPLPTPPAAAMASWGTHDLARFEAYFWGIDIDENERAGHLSAAEAATQRRGARDLACRHAPRCRCTSGAAPAAPTGPRTRPLPPCAAA